MAARQPIVRETSICSTAMELSIPHSIPAAFRVRVISEMVFSSCPLKGGALTVTDYFEMADQSEENGADKDLGSGGTVVLPDQTDASGKVWHLAVGAAKRQTLYLVNRDSMGKFNPAGKTLVLQEMPSFFPVRCIPRLRISTVLSITAA